MNVEFPNTHVDFLFRTIMIDSSGRNPCIILLTQPTVDLTEDNLSEDDLFCKETNFSDNPRQGEGESEDHHLQVNRRPSSAVSRISTGLISNSSHFEDLPEGLRWVYMLIPLAVVIFVIGIFFGAILCRLFELEL